MNFDHLSEKDMALIGQALRAAADGPFFPDWEFHTLFGLTRNEVRAVADGWPTAAPTDEQVALAVNNSLNNLLGYPHKKDSDWSQWISADRQTIQELFNRLRDSANESYFERLQ